MITLKDEYVIQKQVTWLNNCGISPANKKALQKMQAYLGETSTKGFNEMVFAELQNSIKKYLSGLFRCKPEELAIMHNTAEGMNIVSRGISLKEGQNIILLKDEYPSNYYPWLHWKNKGIEIKILDAQTSDEYLVNLLSLIDSNTAVLSLSAAHWLTGIALPLREIGEICREKNILFFLDGAQGAGHIEVHPHEFNVSFMALSGWKWLLGPLGLGIIYCDQNFLNRVEPLFTGMNSYTPDNDFLPYQSELKNTTERFNFSTPAVLDWVYFEAGLSLLSRFKPEEVQARLHELAKYLHEKLKDNGFRCFDINFDENPTAIIVADHEDFDSQKLFEVLQNENVVSALRNNRLRFSAHIYNTEDELDHVIDILKKQLAR